MIVVLHNRLSLRFKPRDSIIFWIIWYEFCYHNTQSCITCLHGRTIGVRIIMAPTVSFTLTAGTKCFPPYNTHETGLKRYIQVNSYEENLNCYLPRQTEVSYLMWVHVLSDDGNQTRYFEMCLDCKVCDCHFMEADYTSDFPEKKKF